MFHAVDELVRFCEEHGVDTWVTGPMGERLRLDDWAQKYVDQVSAEAAGPAADDAERMQELRAMLNQNPNQKTIAIRRIREVIDD